MASHAAAADGYKPRHYRGWRRNRDRRRWIAGGSLEGMLAVIPSMPRPALARLVQQAIDRMDDIDADADLELSGDEFDGSLGEDDFCCHDAGSAPGPGCSLSDAAEDEEIGSAGQGQAVIVSITRGRSTKRRALRRRLLIGEGGLK